MSTETIAGAPDVEAGPRLFPWVWDMVLAYHDEWAYLASDALPVRPPTEDESAAYEARRDNPDWHDLYNPPDPADIARAVIPDRDWVAAVEDAAAELEPLPEPGAWLRDTEAQFAAERARDDEAEERATRRFMAVHEDTGPGRGHVRLIPAVRDEQGAQDWDPFDDEPGEPDDDEYPATFPDDDPPAEPEDDPEPPTAIAEAVEVPPLERTRPKWFPFRRSDSGPDEVA